MDITKKLTVTESENRWKKWLAELEAKERERTGIKNLKVKYNKVFGYYLEVTNSYKDLSSLFRLSEKTDPGKCGTIFYAGVKGIGGYHIRGRR